MTFKARLRAGEMMVGAFIKTPHPTVVEVLSRSDLDCLVLDAEHAPFGREAIDLCTLAARAGGKAVLVRPQSAAPEHLLNALDCGATGVLAPHIRSADEARALVKACQYGPGGRGFAGSSRAAHYTGKPMVRHLADSAQETTVVAQIEDVEAVEAIEEIAHVDGIDALFVGRADLTIALGCDNPDDPRVIDAVERVCAAGQTVGRTVGMFLSRTSDAPYWRAKGARFFVLSSDHGFLLAGANALARDAKA